MQGITGSSFERDQGACCGVAVMAKASAPGRTKTRLVPPLIAEEAAAFNTAFLKDIAGNLLAAGQRSAIVGYMAYGPAGSEDFFKSIMPAEIGRLEASLPNFGDCLFRTVEQLLQRGHRSAVVLNSDSPTLPTSLLVETADVLAQPGGHAVLGPASDGGYYLLGVKQAHRRLFDEIDWSTERVARQTLARAREIHLDVHVLPVWYDVDDIEALRRLHAELREGRRFCAGLEPHHAPHTAALMTSLDVKGDLSRRIGRRRVLQGAQM